MFMNNDNYNNNHYNNNIINSYNIGNDNDNDLLYYINISSLVYVWGCGGYHFWCLSKGSTWSPDTYILNHSHSRIQGRIFSLPLLPGLQGHNPSAYCPSLFSAKWTGATAWKETNLNCLLPTEESNPESLRFEPSTQTITLSGHNDDNIDNNNNHTSNNDNDDNDNENYDNII